MTMNGIYRNPTPVMAAGNGNNSNDGNDIGQHQAMACNETTCGQQ